jgi:site-specific DNA recombinase
LRYIYARVSAANSGQDPTLQTRELQEYCARRGWTVSGEYVHIGISGTKEKRPELDRTISDLSSSATAPSTVKTILPAERGPSKPLALGFGVSQSHFHPLDAIICF